MMSCPRPSSWLHLSLHAGAWAKRRRLTTFLRLEELEHRLTPSVTVVPQQFTTNQYTAFTVGQSQLLAGDSGSGTLTVSNPTQPANATLVDNQNGTFTFTPDPSFTGSTTFQYTVGTAPSTLMATDTTANDLFGDAVAIDGNTAVVGARFHTVNGQTDQGVAYVFARSGNTWSEQAELIAPDGAANDFFGYSVAVSGDTAVIGAYGHDGGAVYVFVRSGSTWSQQAELTPADAGFGGFGSAVSLSGDTAVIGAPEQVVNGNFEEGAAYVFVRSGSSWSQQAELTIADGTAYGFFGRVVSVSGETAVIGGISDSGHAYVFVGSGGTWSQQAELTAPDGSADEDFGNSVSVSGSTVLIGAGGKAYVFGLSGNTWSEQAELNPAGSVDFGGAVSVDGNTAVVGSDEGAYVFVQSGSTWNQQGSPLFSDLFTSPVAVSGDTVLVPNPYGPTVYVQDFGTATATATVQVDPATADLTVSPATLPIGTEGQVYATTTFTATGGAGGGYTFQESGILPLGITFDAATGQLAGTPTQFGDFPGIVIAASDGQGGSGSQTYTLTVSHYGVNGFPVPYPPTIYAPPTSKTDPNADLDAYISGLYHSILDRDPEAGATSLPFWENVYNLVQTGAQANPLNLPVPAGTAAYQYVADGIWQSQEHRWDEVQTYYQDFLGRTLDLTNAHNLAEGQYWVNQFLDAGATEEDVIRGFLTSPEYLYDHRADASLANALNTNLPSGLATAEDLQTWNADLSGLDAQRASLANQTFATPEDYTAQLSAANLDELDNETAQTGVLFDMLASNEYQQAALNSFYQAFLRRAGTQAEEQALLSQKDANGNPLSLGAIAEMILASPEYRTNAVNSEV
jgi:FG-GAP repeat/Cadherin-like domain/Putative Ig domain